MERSATRIAPASATPYPERGLRRQWLSSAEAREVLDLYRFQPWTSRLEYRMRLAICPFEEVASRVPVGARVLDLGCGYGLLANLVALADSRRRVVGLDVAEDRIAIARRSALGRSEVRFATADVTEVELEAVDCIVMNDLLHHVPHDRQIPLLEKCAAALPPGGTLLIKDVDKSTLWKYCWNYAHDLLKNRWLPFYCLDRPILAAILDLVGFQVETHRLDAGFPYSHVLYVCTREERPARAPSSRPG